MFKLKSNFSPGGGQPEAIAKLTRGLKKGLHEQTLLGVTGSGKTFTMANIIAGASRPTLIISHNKTLAAQLYGEFRRFFPDNAVHYFVSYYDYYQPEAYIPQTDTYIEKEATINEEIDRLRHAATQSLINRHDVIIVASVSCIYGIGEKEDYKTMGKTFRRRQIIKRNELLRQLVKIQYERDDRQFRRGQIRVKGEIIDIYLATGEAIVRIELFGDLIKKIYQFNLLPGGGPAWNRPLKPANGLSLEKITILPAKHFLAPEEKLNRALAAIKKELAERIHKLKKAGKTVEAYRLEKKTNYDLEMIEAVGYCPGIENYSRHLSERAPGEPPATLMDFFPSDYLVFIDEAHATLPQIRGMYAGDRSRKQTLIDFGFRLPSALDNRPLKFAEFKKKLNQVIYVSATPGPYEIRYSAQIVEQLIRPTGLLDPAVEVRATDTAAEAKGGNIKIKPTPEGQISDLIAEIKKTVARGQRILVTTLTKRMAEELAAYLNEQNIKVTYLHSEINTLERVDILRDLRQGRYDVLIGVNLLREGLDLPEVSLVAILDADMAGFLRNKTSLMQTMGRAARHANGRVIMYADTITPAMRAAIREIRRRRRIQTSYNKKHKIKPASIKTKLLSSIN